MLAAVVLDHFFAFIAKSFHEKYPYNISHFSISEKLKSIFLALSTLKLNFKARETTVYSNCYMLPARKLVMYENPPHNPNTQ